MSFFRSKTRITVNTTVTRVVEDKMLPDSIRAGLLSSLLGTGEIAGNVIEGLLQNVGIKANRMYEYGNNDYIYGLPSGQTYRATEGKPEVIAILETLEGEPIHLEYCHFGPPNNLHIGWTELIENHGYDPVTNQLGVLSTSLGTPVYLDDMQVVVTQEYLDETEPRALDQWGTPATAGLTPERTISGSWRTLRTPTYFLAEGVGADPYVRADYVWVSPLDGEILKASFPISLGTYDEEADYFHAKYVVDGQTKFWMYKQGDGLYPELDSLFSNEFIVNGTYFPFAYFRFNNIPDTTDPGSSHYQSSKRLLKYLGLDYGDIAGAINSNPDISDVHQALLMMAVPAVTTNEHELRYLYDYFSAQYEASPIKYRTPLEATIAAVQEGTPDLNDASITIRDARFNMSLSTKGIVKRRIPGTIGEVGAYGTFFGSVRVPYTYIEFDPDGDRVIESGIDIPCHYYRKQINKFFYDEVAVLDLRTTYAVYGSYGTAADGLDRTLLIPIDRSITEAYSVPFREVLYSRSMHFVFNSVQITKIRWYQTTFFKALLIIAAIVVSVMTGVGGTLLNAAIYGTAAQLGTILVTLLVSFVKSLVISFGLQLIAQALGPELAFIFAITAAVVAGVHVFNAGSIQGAPWAQELLQLANGLVSAGNKTLELQFKELGNQFRDFQAYIKEKTDELDAAKKLLESDNAFSPFIIFGESPDDYYNRTVHSGNIGVSALSAVSSYVDIALTLPKLDETLRGEFYESI